jgi:hypothetical protein
VAAAQVFDTATAVARATATQQAMIGITATIQAQGTDIAEQKTQQAPMVWAKQTAVAAQAESAVIELQKTKATMWAIAWSPFVIGIVLLAMFAYYFWRKSKFGFIQDKNGRLQMVMIGDSAFRPDLMFGPVINFGKQITAPNLGTPDSVQQSVNHDRMIVDAVLALPMGYQKQAMGMTAGLSNSRPAVNIQVVQPGENGVISQWDADIQAKMAQEVRDD